PLLTGLDARVGVGDHGPGAGAHLRAAGGLHLDRGALGGVHVQAVQQLRAVHRAAVAAGHQAAVPVHRELVEQDHLGDVGGTGVHGAQHPVVGAADHAVRGARCPVVVTTGSGQGGRALLVQGGLVVGTLELAAHTLDGEQVGPGGRLHVVGGPTG